MKRRSAKQRANDKRLGMYAKRNKRKTNKRSSTKKRIVAKRRSVRRSVSSYVKRKGGLRGIGGNVVSYAKPMAAGVGGGMIAEQIAARVAPQYTQMAGYGGAYLAGGIKGVAGKVVYDVLSGQGSPLNLFGGGGGGNPGL